MSDMNSLSRQTKRIEINNANAGLKIKVIGGVQLQKLLPNYRGLSNEPDFGIFIKQVIPGDALFDHELIQPGNQLLSVNDVDLESSTYSRAINILRLASKNSFMAMTLSSDDIARSEYANLIEWKETKAERKLKMSGKSNQGFVDEDKKITLNEKSNNNKTTCDLYKKHVVIEKSAAGLGLRVKDISDPKVVQFLQKHHLACFEILPLSPGGDVYESKSLRGGDLLYSFNDQLLDEFAFQQINCLLLQEKLRVEKTTSFGYISAYDIEKFTSCNDNHEAETSQNSSLLSGRSQLSEDEMNNNENKSCEMVVRLNEDGQGHYHMQNFLELENKLRQQESENKLLCANMQDVIGQQNRSVEDMKQIEAKTLAEVGAMKREYEEIIRVMEEEMRALRTSEINLVPSSPLEGVQDKQIAILECECRKLTEAKHEYRTQIEQLTAFLSKFLTKVSENTSLHGDNAVQELVIEAQNILLNQKQVIDLPYGWEKASLSDGRLFYIDHANHVTSWTPPFGEVVENQPGDGAAEQVSSEGFITENRDFESDRKQSRGSDIEDKHYENELRDVSDIDFTHCYTNVPSSSSSPEML